MQPGDLQPTSFAGYPPKGAALARASLPLLRRLPMPLLPIVLREVSGFDWKFPREREEVRRQVRWLEGMPPGEFAAAVGAFQALHLPAALSGVDWVNDPAGYMEQLTAALWSTGQMPAFRQAATAYGDRLARVTGDAVAVPAPSTEEGARPQAATGHGAVGHRAVGLGNIGRPVASARTTRVPRLVLAVLAAELGKPAVGQVLYRKLRRQGVLLDHVSPAGGMEALRAEVQRRAATEPGEYAHWTIDGGSAQDVRGVASVGYGALRPVREHLLGRARTAMNGQGADAARSGPEELRTLMAHLTPEAAGMAADRDPVMAHFELALLTEGSGTQIFSTTFVQWAARECLRRAHPTTLLARWTPRQREQGMNELLSGAPSAGEDPAGSLVDADQGAWYTWLNLQRLPGAESSRFLVWQEGSSTAVAVGPGLPHGSTASSPMTMAQVLQLLA